MTIERAEATHAVEPVSMPAMAVWELNLRPSKTWESFEQLRLEGGSGICNAVEPGSVGFLRIKGNGFAIMRRDDFDRLVGIASEARRIIRGIPLLRQAAELVIRHKDEELAIRHLREMTLAFPEPLTSSSVTFEPVPLSGADEAHVELDLKTFKAPRARTSSAADSR